MLLREGKDIRADAELLQSLDWSADNRAASVNRLYEYAVAYAAGAIRWYDRRRRARRFWAHACRLTTLVTVTAAAVVPMLSGMSRFQANDRAPLVDPLWSGILLAIAAFALAADRFWGFTSGWMRCAQPPLRISALLNEFCLEWQAGCAATAAQSLGATRPSLAIAAATTPTVAAFPPDDHVQERIEACRAFLADVQRIVRAETDAWAAEPQKGGSAADCAIRTFVREPPPPCTGAVNITMTNGSQSQNGWTLSVDGRPPQGCAGQMVARGDLAPGTHHLGAQGIINQKLVQAQSAVEIAAGKVTSVTMTLM